MASMVVLLALGFPLLLLGLMLAMERVEAPLRDAAIGDRLEQFLESSRPEEIEAFVRDGLSRPLDRYWHRRGWWARLALRRLATRG
jgi:hypothetical protein